MDDLAKARIERKLQKIGLTPGSADYELAKKSLSKPDEPEVANKLSSMYGEAPKKAPPLPSEIGKYSKGGTVGSASKRADGIAKRGKTRGKIC